MSFVPRSIEALNMCVGSLTLFFALLGFFPLLLYTFFFLLPHLLFKELLCFPFSSLGFIFLLIEGGFFHLLFFNVDFLHFLFRLDHYLFQ